MRKALYLALAFAFMLVNLAVAQERAISGTVTDGTDGSQLPGVNVLVKGTSSGTITDVEGKFQIKVSEGAVLVFSYLGYVKQEVTIGAESVLTISLAVDAKSLDEVVVVGYGEQSTRNSVQSVNSIKSESMKNMPAISPQQLLQGQAAGVQMVNSSGVLGSASTVRIRGASSISGGSGPLYVVDGVPLNDGGNGAFSTQQGAGSALNPLLDINPNDIESMTVLKDASAVAIYGSRGANGVILIKTKRGKSGDKTRINFDYNTGTSKPTNVLSYMQPDQYKGFINEYEAARNQTRTVFPEGGFDWVDGVLRTGKVNTYNLSMAGGSDKTTYFVGAGYHDESGYTIGNDLKRLSGRFNMDHQINERFRTGVNFSISNTWSDRIGAENSTFAPLTSSYLQSPAVKPFNADGTYAQTGFIGNVLAIEALNDNKFYLRRQTGSIYAEADIVKDLTFRTQWGIDLAQSEEMQRVVNVVTPGGSGSKFVNQDYKWLTTNTLKYDKEIGDAHSFNLLLGQSFETAENEFIQVAGTGFVSDLLRNVSSAAVKSTTEGNGTAWALSSFFGRFNYRLKDRYLFEASLRRDGSSRFGANFRHGNFWAVSGGWIISDEAFMDNVKFIDQLKLTASIGTSGNDRLSNLGNNFLALGLFGAGVAADYAGASGLIPTQVPNPNLSWEETRQSDIGISGSLFKSKLDFSVNYYSKLTTGLLLNNPYPFTTGFASASANIGEMRNRGWDIQLSTTNLKKKDFVWTTSFNIGFLKNEVLKLPTNKDEYGNDHLVGSASQRAVVGYSQNEFYLVRYKGVNPQTGHAEWLNKNGEPTTTPLGTDRVYVGSAIPDFTGGITNTFRYKGLDLTAFFNYSYGNFVMIDGLRFTENMAGTYNKSTDLLNYWKQPGDNAFAPAIGSPTAATFAQRSDYQLQDGSFLRLKTLSLGYSIPESLLKRTKSITSSRVFMMAQNIWTLQNKNFRGPDPEVSANGSNAQIVGESFFALPQAKSITFGINLSF